MNISQSASDKLTVRSFSLRPDAGAFPVVGGSRRPNELVILPFAATLQATLAEVPSVGLNFGCLLDMFSGLLEHRCLLIRALLFVPLAPPALG